MENHWHVLRSELNTWVVQVTYNKLHRLGSFWLAFQEEVLIWRRNSRTPHPRSSVLLWHGLALDMNMYSCTQVYGDLLRLLGSIELWPLSFYLTEGDHI